LQDGLTNGYVVVSADFALIILTYDLLLFRWFYKLFAKSDY